jgi:asparagine synthase (glutamine-hydrolysing)
LPGQLSLPALMQGEVDFSDSHPDLRPNTDGWSTAGGHVAGTDARDSSGSAVSAFGLKLIGDIALHNRADLLEALEEEPGIDRNTCDDRLVLSAYRKWNERCADFLLGEFAFAIWDDRERRLFCCRDHLGSRLLFYYRDRDRVIFANDPRRILGTGGVPRQVNLRKIAVLAVPGGRRSYPEETFHLGIRLLPPGAWMAVDRTGVRQQVYWRPEIREDLLPRGEREVFEALGALLKQAVECRVERSGATAAHLSGGLDSSAVVTLAARYLGAKNRTLNAFSAVVPDQTPSIQDEREFIDELAGYPGVRLNYVNAQGRGPFDWIDNPSRFESTPIVTSRQYLIDALQDAAREQGADLLLQGLGGEYGPTGWGRGYYFELAVTGRWPTLVSEMIALRRVRGISPIRALGGEALDVVFPRRRHVCWLLLHAGFVRSSGVSATQVPWGSRWPDERRRQAATLRSWLDLDALKMMDLFEVGGLRLSNPLLDKRVMEFCLAARGGCRVRNGYQRYLVRMALDGILPRKIQWRTSKAPFSPDYFPRYNSQLEKVREYVGGIGPRDPIRAVVDVNALHALVQRPPVPDGDFEALVTVPATVYLICFLRQFPEFRP